MAYKLEDMDLFTVVEGGKAITVEKGVYRQSDVYERGGRLYAMHRTGFARLLTKNMTTVPNLRWDDIVGIAFSEDYKGPTRSAGLAAAE